MLGARHPARVEEKRLLGSSVWLTVRIPDWPGARPGQFALLQAEPSACFLARPLSVALEEEDRVSFLVAPIGAGTRELSRLLAGDELWVLGPLGNGFPLDPLLGSAAGRLVLVGGGVGVAPLPLLLRQVARTRSGAGGLVGDQEVLVLLGFRDAGQAEAAAPVLEEVALLRGTGVNCRCVTTTDDGSMGTPGLVTAGALVRVTSRRSGGRVWAGGHGPSCVVGMLGRRRGQELVQPGDGHGLRHGLVPRLRHPPGRRLAGAGMCRGTRVRRRERLGERPRRIAGEGGEAMTASDRPGSPLAEGPDLAVRLGPLQLDYPLINASGTMEILDLANVLRSTYAATPARGGLRGQDDHAGTPCRESTAPHPGNGGRHDQRHRPRGRWFG